MNSQVGMGVAVTAVLLGGCGVTLDAVRVTPSSAGVQAGSLAPTHVRGEGIVYALPRTEFEVSQPIKLKFSTAGGLRDTYDGCKRACDASPASIGDACDFDNAPRLLFAPPELRTNSVPDYSRLYQITPTADLFQSLNFKFEIASNGVVDKIDTAATNTGFEVVAGIATSLIKAVGAPSARVVMDASRRKPGLPSRTCFQTSSDIATLLKKESGALTCSLVKEVENCLGPYERDVIAAQKVLNNTFDSAQKSKLEADLVTAIAGNRRERLALAIQRRDNAAALFGLGDGKDVEAVYQVILPMGGPGEFQNYANEVTLGPAVTSGTARVITMSDNAGSFLNKLLPQLKLSTRHYLVSSAMPPNFEVLKSEEAGAVGKGYRYRVPVAAPSAMTVFKDSGKTTYEYGPITDNKVVAQYGPIAALPSSFKGKGGRVLVKHWPGSGGLQTVEIGADALPSSAVTDVVSTALTQAKAARDKAATIAAAAAAADPELDSLNRQQKILSLQKQIKDLEADLAKKD